MKHVAYFVAHLVFILNLINTSKALSSLRLDYTLFSQLASELETFENTNDVVNYFKLNNETLKQYDEYLYFSEEERLRLKQLTKSMFEFGYDNYMKFAFPLDELNPIYCKGRGPDYANPDNINVNDALGDYLLTLVESLSTLAVMGNSSEFKRASLLIIEHLNFDKSNTVQVFESTIRVLGGLLTSHLIMTDPNQPFGNMTLDNYDGELLKLAHDLGVRLLTAFEHTSTGIPYPRINLKHGVPKNSFNHTCTSGASTLLLEFSLLSQLTGDPIYEKVARKSVDSIFLRRNNSTGLVGNELHIHTGDWLGSLSGLGAGIDSLFEYLFKSYVALGETKDLKMYEEFKKSIKAQLRRGRNECFRGDGHHPIYVNVNMYDAKLLNNWIDSLQASYPAVQVLEGELEEAVCFHALYFAIWKKFGVLPERYNWHLKLPDVYFYPLRPEFAEATYFLYRATRNPFYLHAAKLITENINSICRVKCGFATVHDVIDKSLEDRMESFFLSETMKYLYLTFDFENYLNNAGESKYIFTTEGHLYPIQFDQYLNTNKKFKSDKRCFLGKQYKSIQQNLPMKIKYFERLFDMVGVDDNLDKLLERNSM